MVSIDHDNIWSIDDENIPTFLSQVDDIWNRHVSQVGDTWRQVPNIWDDSEKSLKLKTHNTDNSIKTKTDFQNKTPNNRNDDR